MTWTDTIVHSDIFLTFGPRLALRRPVLDRTSTFPISRRDESVDVFVICNRYRYGFAGDNALLTPQYPRLVI